MDFALSEEQELIVATTRAFVENELMPHEAELERTGILRPELAKELKQKAINAGLYAANIPEEFGGVGLDTQTWLLYEKELGKTSYALHWTCVARPSNILCAGTKAQRKKYLDPCLRGETSDCLAMTEPGAGSDLRGMIATAKKDGDDWVLNGTKHFISHADSADFTITFMATGEEDTPRGKKKLISAFFVDHDHPGLTIRDGYNNVSHRGYTNSILEFDDCRVERAFDLAVNYAAEREQFNQKIGKFQGVSFKLADMATEMKAAELLVREAGWKYDQGICLDMDMAMAKLKASEMLAFVADEAIQIYGGMGLMDDLPLERIWRDARIERIWEGTSEIQRHIISRSLLRPLDA